MKEITTDGLRHMSGSEGLILQGCEGDPQEWLDDINEIFTQKGILQDGDTFKDVSIFEHGGGTNLLFCTDNVKLDSGKLTLWQLRTDDAFHGIRLSDYVDHRLGGFIISPQPQGQKKPDSPLIGTDGNIFSLMGIASRTLKDHGMKAEAAEMRDRITSSGSYDAALVIIGEYVNITAAAGYESQDDGEDFCMEELT